MSCIKCADQQKGCSFQPGWTLKDKGKSKGKGKLKVKAAKKSEETEPSHLTKRCKVEVLMPKWSVGESIAQTRGEYRFG